MHGPLQAAERRRPHGRSLMGAAGLALVLLASRPSGADDPVPLETPGTAAPESAATAAAGAVEMTATPPPSLPAGGAARQRPAPFFAALAQPPLDPPLTINGGFGEYRPGHFHAGVDLGTGERVGRPVHAPLTGWIARVRTSGVGYGRSLYLRAGDGRLLQFGHLDAFAEPIAGMVAAIQDSSGQYEQDVWLAPGRYPVRVGDVMAWTGESGAGGPHLHFEVRRGDMAYNPFRAGLAVPDATAPTIVALTLEPLDEASFVERCASPYTLRFGARRDTLRVEGRVRAVVRAYDGAGGGARRIVPWSLAVEFGGRAVECRFDSLSWATDMSECEYVFDAGRIVGDRGLVPWTPAGFRPRVIVCAVPRDQDAGTIVVRPGDPPRALRIVARDAAGLRTTRTVVLRPPPASARGPDTTRAGGIKGPVAPAGRFELAALPGGFWRVLYRGAPRGSRGVRIELGADASVTFAASTRGGEWAAVIPASAWASPWRVTGRDASGLAWDEQGPSLDFGEDAGRVAGGGQSGSARGFRWSVPRDALFEPGGIAENLRPVPEKAPPELARVSIAGRLEPEELALRRPIRVVQSLAALRDTARVGLYRHDPDGWTCLAARAETGAAEIAADSRRLGTFALFADTLAPRVAARTPSPRVSATGPYSRWALEAALTEEGSGVDPRASAFEVDGARVPSEWDAEEHTLRWRPRVPPAAGTHRFTVVAADRAGNVARSSGSFVID